MTVILNNFSRSFINKEVNKYLYKVNFLSRLSRLYVIS